MRRPNTEALFSHLSGCRWDNEHIFICVSKQNTKNLELEKLAFVAFRGKSKMGVGGNQPPQVLGAKGWGFAPLLKHAAFFWTGSVFASWIQRPTYVSQPRFIYLQNSCKLLHSRSC